MKLIFKSICIFCFFILLGCNSKKIQLYGQNVSGSKENIQISKGKGSEYKQINIGERPTPGEIYSRIEETRNVNLKLYSDSSTVTKLYSEAMGIYERKIIFRFQKNRIVTIVQRIFNEKGNIIAFKTFYFNEDNFCKLFCIRDNSEIGERDYIILNGYLVRTDSKYNSIIVEDSEKEQIIKTAKQSLDSIMQHFPEFKYSFNWK